MKYHTNENEKRLCCPKNRIHIASLLFTVLVMIPVLCLAGTVDSHAGEYGFQMLKIPAATSVAAMGGAGAFFAPDAFAYSAHPAVTSAPFGSTGSVVSAVYHQWIMDTSITGLGWRGCTGRFGYGAGLRYLDYGKIDTRDDQGLIIGEYHPMDVDLSGNISARILPDHYMGLTTHILYEKINTASSYGMSFDLGYLWKTPLRGWSMAAALKHFGFTERMEDEVPELPFSQEMSVMYGTEMGQLRLETEGKLIRHPDDDTLKGILGLSGTWQEIFSLRFGYKMNYDIEQVTFGFGVNWHDLQVDYAYLPVTEEELKDFHTVGLSYRFQ